MVRKPWYVKKPISSIKKTGPNRTQVVLGLHPVSSWKKRLQDDPDVLTLWRHYFDEASSTASERCC
jgi:hypothetical protein